MTLPGYCMATTDKQKAESKNPELKNSSDQKYMWKKGQYFRL